jgi:hypothetical protein
VDFIAVGGVVSLPIMLGASTFSFSGVNRKNYFRPGTLIRIKDDLYQVSGVFYDYAQGLNIVSITSEAVQDYSDSADLGDVLVSDCPVYFAGDTEIVPWQTAITAMDQPAFIMKCYNDYVVSLTADTSKLTLDGTSFLYSAYPTLGDMSSAINAANISALSVTTFAPLWNSSKIIPTTAELSVFTDSSTVLYAKHALRYKGASDSTFSDSTNYSIGDTGNVTLTNALQNGDRYSLDYMGREFLGWRGYDRTQVKYSANYFVNLPAGSKVAASFQFKNLDQFYIQALDEKDFFETVTIPRMEDEALQLSGSVGQGGEIRGDSDGGNTTGGIAGDEYRRQDTDIECRIFKRIYDFFDNRLHAYADEYYAAFGLKMFNNDGFFTDAQQNAAAMSVNRIFPTFDYTNASPQQVNPITSYFFDGGVYFTNGSTAVNSMGNTYWTQQLTKDGFIGRTKSTKRYKIAAVNGDTSLTLVDPFEEATTTGTVGEPYTAASTYPIYDDDGNLGAKIIGTKAEDFGLSDGDVFNCTIDGMPYSYAFHDPSDPFLLLFYNVSRMNTKDVMNALMGSIPGLKVTLENVIDPDTSYGYRSTMVLRTIPPKNCLVLGFGAAVSKLGFTPGASSCGNLDPTLNNPEIVVDYDEGSHLTAEIGYLNTLLALTNKLQRVDSIHLPMVDDIYTQIGREKDDILLEIPQINAEMAAAEQILLEPTLPAYAQTLIARNNDTTALDKANTAYVFDSSINPGWQGRPNDWKWALDYTEHNQYVRGKDATNVGVPISSGTGITFINGQTSFILNAPSDHDRRVLNATLFSTYYRPVLKYENNGVPVDGTWTGWDLAVSNQYSLTNKITFNFNDSVPSFAIQRDTTFTTPRFTTTPTDITIGWIEDEGYISHSFDYSPYPTVSALRNAIGTIDGISTTPIYSNQSYVYNDLYIDTTRAISAYPGSTVYTGPGSPAFGIYYDSRYTVVPGQINLNNFMGDFPIVFASYPTLTSLMDVVSSIGYTVLSTFDGNHPYSSLQAATGSVPVTLPGASINFGYDTSVIGIMFGIESPYYSVGVSDVGLAWTAAGVGACSAAYSFAGYSTLNSMATAISSSPGFMSSLLVSGTGAYQYVNLKTISSTAVPGISSPTAIYLGTNSPALGIRTTAMTAFYSINSTTLNLLWDTSSTSINFADCPTLLDLKDSIEAISVFSADVYFADGYAYNRLRVGSGSIGITNTSLYFHFDVPVLSLAFNIASPTYQSSATDLTLRYVDGATTTPTVITYSSFTTLQDLVDEIKTKMGFDAVLLVSAPTYEYGVLRNDINPVAITNMPYTPAYIPAGSTAFRIVDHAPSYESDSSAFVILRQASYPSQYNIDTYNLIFSSYFGSNSIQFAGYSQVGELNNAIEALGYSVQSNFDASYSYGALKIASGSVSQTLPGTPLQFRYDADIIGIKFSITDVFYLIDDFKIELKWNDPAGLNIVDLPLSTYPTLGLMADAISNYIGFYSLMAVPGTESYHFVDLTWTTGYETPGDYVYAYLGVNSPALGIHSTNMSAAYSINATSLHLTWGGSNSAIINFGACPTLLDLKNAIEATSGFFVDVYYADSYVYTALRPSAGPLGIIETSLYFQYLVPAITMNFNASAPTYQSSVSDLTLSFVDGTTTSSYVVPYGSNPTLLDLVNSIKSQPGFDASAIDAPAYEYGALKVNALPVAVSTSSFTPAYIPAGATVSMISSDDGLLKNTFLYSGYSSLSNLQGAITGAFPDPNNVPNIKTTPLFDPTYVYGSLAPSSGVMNTTAPGNSVILMAAPLFKIFFGMDNLRYSIDTTALNIRWEEGSDTVNHTYTYAAYPHVSNMKAAVNTITGLNATGPSAFDAGYSEAFKLASGDIVTSVNVYPALRSSYLEYETISDWLLTDRLPIATDRSGYLNTRTTYLTLRDKQIRGHLLAEETLKTADGAPGDLYAWANNRFNRRQGCYAKLKQIEAQIASNQSALAINKSMI